MPVDTRTVAEKILVALREGLLAGGAPVVAVHEAETGLDAIPAGTLHIMPALFDIGTGAGVRRTLTMTVKITAAERLGSASTEHANWGPVLGLIWAVLERLHPKNLDQRLREAGALAIRRSRFACWGKPPRGPGDPAGCVGLVEVDFVA